MLVVKLVFFSHIFLFPRVSSASARVFNLERTEFGLAFLTPSNRPYYVESTSPTSRVDSFLGSTDPAFLEDADHFIIPIPLTVAIDPLLCLDFPSRLSITPGSSFGAHYHSAMLVPPSDTNPNFQLLAGLTDPSAHCFEGAIGYATMAADTIGFFASVSLVSTEDETLTVEAVRSQWGVNVASENTVIPYFLYRLWHSEVMRVAGVQNWIDLDQMDWTTFVHLLPTLQYQIYVSSDSEQVAATIVMQPEDYIEILSPVGANVKISPGNMERPGLGLSALKHVAIVLDYENSQIGFCEPI